MTRFIKIAADIDEFGWYKDANTFRVFFHLLLKANWKDIEYMGHLIKRGSLVSGRKQLALELNLSERNIRTAINHLKSTNKVTIKTTNRFSVITICDYERWCGQNSQSDQQIDQQSDQQVTSKRPASDQQVTTTVEYIEEIEEIEEKKNIPPNPLKGETRACEADLFGCDTQHEKKKRTAVTYPKEFEDDFKLYNRKGGKKKAYERWQKLSEEDKVKMRRHIPYYMSSNDIIYLKDFEGYINQRTFESVIYGRNKQVIYDPNQADTSTGYNPNGMYVSKWGDGFIYMGSYDPYCDKQLYDGYNDTDRPDGATLLLNNARGTARWNKALTKWEITK